MARNTHRTTPKHIELREKQARALELRKQGKSYEQIAAECGFNSHQAAYDSVKRSIERITLEPAKEVIALELERLDAMWVSHYSKAQEGDVASLTGCLRLMERRAKLLGIDSPDRSEITGKDGAPLELPTVVRLVAPNRDGNDS